MSQLARRLYYLSAFLIFAVIAPLLLAWTSGYRWSNVRTGFVRTGALVVYSTPRADVRINGVLQGSTPFRQTHLSPGSYTVTVSKSGYADWVHTVRITPNTAQVIGPVLLFHPNFTQIPHEVLPGDQLLHDADFRVMLGSQSTADGATVQVRWPINDSTTFQIPSTPERVLVSPNAQSYIFAEQKNLIVVQRKDLNRLWTLPNPTSIAWDVTSDGFFFGITEGTATRFDISRQETQSLAPANSLTTSGDTLWIARINDTDTTVLKLPTFGQTTPTTVGTIPGKWNFVQSSVGALLMKNSVTDVVNELRYSPVSGTLTSVPFGTVDQLWWTDRSQPPIWLSGSDILTRDVDDQIVLIDRVSTPMTDARWIDSGHVLVMADAQSFVIRSVSSRQGRGTLLEARFAEGMQLQAVDMNKKAALVSVTEHDLRRLIELRW